MKKILNVIVLLFLMFDAQAEIVVIGNKNNALTLNSEQVEDIFMGRNRALSNGSIAIPVDQANLRTEFYQKLLNSSVEKIDAYWKMIELSNQVSSNKLSIQQPPKILSSDIDVLNAVNANKDAIGYISRRYVNGNIRILLVID